MIEREETGLEESNFIHLFIPSLQFSKASFPFLRDAIQLSSGTGEILNSFQFNIYCTEAAIRLYTYLFYLSNFWCNCCTTSLLNINSHGLPGFSLVLG